MNYILEDNQIVDDGSCYFFQKIYIAPNAEEMPELENCHFLAPPELMNLNSNHKWMLNWTVMRPLDPYTGLWK